MQASCLCPIEKFENVKTVDDLQEDVAHLLFQNSEFADKIDSLLQDKEVKAVSTFESLRPVKIDNHIIDLAGKCILV